MASIFTKIINGEIPGIFVWKDDQCVAFADINPVAPGHVLLVPRVEVDNFWEADPQMVAHLAQVAQIIAQAQIKTFQVARSCQVIAGFDVPHLHLHLIPANSMREVDLSLGAPRDFSEIQSEMERLKASLAQAGHAEQTNF